MTVFNINNVDKNKLDLTSDQNAVDLTMREAVKVNPQQHSNVIDVNKQLGFNSDIDFSSDEDLMADLKVQNMGIKGLSERSPKTAKWLQNFDNAVLAQNDTGLLEDIEKFFTDVSNVDLSKTFDNFGDAVSLGFQKQGEGIAISSADSTPRNIADFQSSVQSALPLGLDFMAHQITSDTLGNLGIESDEQLSSAVDEAINESIDRIKHIEKQQQEITPGNLNIVEEGIRSGSVSLVNMLPGMALSVATGNPSPMLISAGGQTYFDSYAEARSKGKDENEAAVFAGVNAGIEVLTEIIPAKLLTNMFKGTGIKKKAGKFIVTDFAGEQAATLFQSLNAYVNDLDEQLAAAETLEEKIQIQARRQAVTAVATLVSSSTQATIAGGVNKVVTALDKSEKNNEQQFQDEQHKIDTLEQLVAQTEIAKTNPESFKQHIQELDAGQNTHVFFDAVQTRLYLNENDSANDEALTIIKNNINDNGDIAVPVADFATHIIGTDHFTALREFMTMSAKTTAPFRKSDRDQHIREYMTKLVNDARENSSMYAESQTIANSVRDKAIETGILSDQQASLFSQVAAQWAVQHAVNNGKTLEEAWQLNDIVGPFKQQDEIINTDLLKHPKYEQDQSFGDLSVKKRVKIAGTNKTSTVKQSAQKLFDQNYKRRQTMLRLTTCLNR